MRYSRFKRKRTKQRYAAFLLIALLLFGGIYIAFAGTLGKFVSSFISPLLSNESEKSDDTPKTPGNDEGPELTVPGKTDEEAVKITDRIKANNLSIKAIQMGAFTDGQNADAFAEELRAKGGAGYVVNDKYYRVLAIGFQSEADAKQVKEQLKEDGIESQVYEIASPGANMEITATVTNVEAVKDAFATWESKYSAVEDIIKDLDLGRIGATDAYKMMEEYKEAIDAKKEELEALAAKQNNNTILTGLVDLYGNSSQTLEEVLAENTSNKVAISSKIKYSYIEMLMNYRQYMEQITGT